MKYHFSRLPQTIQAFGNSMLPFFKNEDVINYKKISFQKVVVDDFVVFKRDNTFITHRVIYTNFRTSPPFLITKGDNNLYPDTKVLSKDFLGIVTQVTRGRQVSTPHDIYLMQSTLYFAELVALKKALEQKNLDYLVLKGLPLHLYIEKKHPKRLYADCDILIRKIQWDNVQRALEHLGYKRDDTSLTSVHQKLQDKVSEISFSKSLHGFKIIFDIHLQPVFLLIQLGSLNPLYPETLMQKLTDDFFENHHSIRLHAEKFTLLSDEYLFVYLLLHLFHHNFKGYNRYQILDLLLRKKSIDFEKVWKIIQKFKLHNFIYPGLLLLQKYYDSPLPKRFIKSLTPSPHIQKKIQQTIIKENIFRDDFRVSSGVKRFQLIFLLSPNNFFQKSWIFLYPQVMYSIFWVLLKRGRYLFTLAK